MKCDVIASGIVNAAKQVGLRMPLIVRLEVRLSSRSFCCCFLVGVAGWLARLILRKSKATETIKKITSLIN